MTAPEGVTILDDPEETIVIVSAPRLQSEETEEIEAETERVGEEPAASGGRRRRVRGLGGRVGAPSGGPPAPRGDRTDEEHA